MASPLKTHVVIFPFMAQGHTLPLLDLSKALSHRDIKVTIITTASNAISIAQSTADHPLISIAEIPFPAIHGLPKGCENTTQLPSMEFFLPFLQATKQLQKPFEQVLENMSQSNDLPICVVSDFFLGWTLQSCQAFGVPRLVFHGMGVLSMALVKSAWVHAPNLENISSSDPLYLPGMDIPFVLTAEDLPERVNSPHDDPFCQFIGEVAEAEMNSWGVIVNSFLELEGNYVSSLESFYKNNAKAWCIGPLSLYGDNTEPFQTSLNHEMIMKWLSMHTMPASVIYVSFGTQADISDAQLDEIAYGLEESGHPFLWAVRSPTWSVPVGMEERVKGRGLITKKWVEQRSILGHRATGGFLSHCGWNSVLESLSAGVPIMAWPMMPISEQDLNARFIVDGLEAGIGIEKMQGLESKAAGDDIVSRHAIFKGVKELIEGSKGKVARERAQGLGEVAMKAVQEDGSSYHVLGKLIDQLCACRLK